MPTINRLTIGGIFSSVFSQDQIADTGPATAPIAASLAPVGAGPKRDRRRRLTKVDRRSALGRRIAELSTLFTSATGWEEITPLRRFKIAAAAELTAVAEKARGQYLRDGDISADDCVRMERRADAAVRALRLREESPKPASPLASHFNEAAE
jgi:hypothetical protein